MTNLKTICILSAASAALAVSVNAQDLPNHPQTDFATGSPTGGWYPIGAQIADMTNRFYDGQPVSVVPGGGVGNVARVGQGEAEIGISYGSFLRVAMTGEGDMYEQEMPELRALAGLLPTIHHIIATPASGVKTFADLAEGSATAATGVPGSGEFFTLQALFSEHDLDIKDISGRVRPMQTQGRVDAWQNQQIDVVDFFLNIPASSISELLSAREGVWVEIDQESADGLKEKYGYVEYTIPAGTYPGQAEDVRAMGMPMVVFASTRLDEELAYNITRAIAEGQANLRSVHSGFEEWDASAMPEGVGIDLHAGAERFYREQGWIN